MFPVHLYVHILPTLFLTSSSYNHHSSSVDHLIVTASTIIFFHVHSFPFLVSLSLLYIGVCPCFSAVLTLFLIHSIFSLLHLVCTTLFSPTLKTFHLSLSPPFFIVYLFLSHFYPLHPLFSVYLSSLMHSSHLHLSPSFLFHLLLSTTGRSE